MGCSASKAAPELGKDHPLSPAQSTEAHSGTRSPQSAVSPQKKALTKPDSAAPGFSRPAVVNDVVVVENRVEVRLTVVRA